MQAESTDVVDELDASAVIRYLTSNPEFFNQNEDILPRLRIPHVSGRAVSLIERQVSVLRGKCSSLENSLRDLIGVARANEALQLRLHLLVQEVISAPSLDGVLAATRRNLCEHFGADEVHVLLLGDELASTGRSKKRTAAKARANNPKDDAAPAPKRRRKASVKVEGDGYRRMGHDDPALAGFADLFEAGGTRCGLPEPDQLAALVGGVSADIGSAAIIPLRHEGPLGLVMLTSRDESRFGAGKGVVFLDQLGDVLGRRLHALRRDAS